MAQRNSRYAQAQADGVRKAQRASEEMGDIDKQKAKKAHASLAKALGGLRDATMYLDSAAETMKVISSTPVKQVHRSTSKAADDISNAYKVVNHMAAALNQLMR